MNNRPSQLGYFLEGLHPILESLSEEVTRIIEQNPADADRAVVVDDVGPLTLPMIRDRANEYRSIVGGILERAPMQDGAIENLSDLDVFSSKVTQFCWPGAHPTPASPRLRDVASRLADYSIALDCAYMSFKAGRESVLEKMHEADQERSGPTRGRGR